MGLRSLSTSRRRLRRSVHLPNPPPYLQNVSHKDVVLHPLRHWRSLYVFPFSPMLIFQLTHNPGEPIGYLSRALAANNTDSLVLYLLQALFLLLPPVLFAASLYMVYSRIVRSVNGARFSLVSPRLFTRIFVLGDWVCLNIQSTGGGLTANEEHVHIGDAIVVAGLGLQILIFVGFLYCCVSFHIRFKKHLRESGEQVQVPWEGVVNMLYANSLLISVRNLFRLVEYVMGKGSYLFAHEWPTYVFDGALMAVVMLGFAVRYPDLLARRKTESMIELRSDDRGVEESESK